MDARIAQVLPKVLPGGAHERATVTPLPGGITNKNFVVQAGDRKLVVRLAGSGTEHLGIDRRFECETAAIAAAAGISPRVLHADPAGGVLVSDFVDGKELTPETARRPPTFRRVVEAIRAIHRLPSFPGSFSPFETVRAYQAAAAGRGVSFPAAFAGALALMGRIETALGRDRPRTPCHNDLLAGNLIDDGRKIWIVDWEYAGMGDPDFDLGNFAVNLGLGPADVGELVAIYGAPPARIARVHLMRLASDLREAAWGFLQSAVSALDFDFSAYGTKHLDRALANARLPEFESWLESCHGP